MQHASHSRKSAEIQMFHVNKAGVFGRTCWRFFRVLLSETSFKNMALLGAANLGEMRTPYKQDALIEMTAKEPFSLFKEWFEEARRTEGIKEPNAMALATADKDGKPSCRFVLLKGFTKDGFTFFTNYESRKGKELAENPYASLAFYWEKLNRQIRIEGRVQKLSSADSEEYFHSRPRKSQLAATIGNQSRIIPSREVLMGKQEELENMYSDESKTIPKPDFWGGYLLIPSVIEFWQGQTNRLHDRIRFRHLESSSSKVSDSDEGTSVGEDGWVYERLFP